MGTELQALTIRNVVLIERLDLSFEVGFCALTGETGAGKSILLDSLGLALGMRAEAGLVRKGADQAVVGAEFSVSSSHPVHSLLHDQGLESDSTLILRRVLNADGRSRAFINDQSVSIGLLRQAGHLLVEIHGQFQTQGLLDVKTHRGVLDDYAGVDNGVSSAWENWKAEERALRAAEENARQARIEEEYLRQAVADLETLSPEVGEEEKLAILRDRLMKREQVLENLNIAYDGMRTVEETLNTVWRALEKTGEEGLLSGLDRVTAELQEVLGQAQSLSSDLDEPEHSLETIDDRLFALRGQARKHGCSVDDLPRLYDDLVQKLTLAERQEEHLDILRDKVACARTAYIEKAQSVHDLRIVAAQKLDGLVARELPPLKMEKARFVTAVEKQPEESCSS